MSTSVLSIMIVKTLSIAIIYSHSLFATPCSTQVSWIPKKYRDKIWTNVLVKIETFTSDNSRERQKQQERNTRSLRQQKVCRNALIHEPILIKAIWQFYDYFILLCYYCKVCMRPISTWIGCNLSNCTFNITRRYSITWLINASTLKQ